MTEWYYERNGERTGPVSETVMLSLRNGGVITDETLVWRRGMEAWQKFRSTELVQRASPYAVTGAAPTPAATATDASRVVLWHRIYCIAFAVLSLGFAALGVFLLVAGSRLEAESGANSREMTIMGGIYAATGLLFSVPFFVSPFLRPQPWVWIYGLVLICIGFSSPCCLPASVPLLIYWLKPEVRRHFGREI